MSRLESSLQVASVLKNSIYIANRAGVVIKRHRFSSHLRLVFLLVLVSTIGALLSGKIGTYIVCHIAVHG